MKTMNKTQLIGYVGADPKTTDCKNGAKMVILSVATDHAIKNKKGEKEYISTWHNIIAFGPTAEIAVSSFSKGSHILVEGHLVYRTFQDKIGHTRYMTEIIAYRVMNLDR